MIIAMILVGGGLGAISALVALILGQTLWTALLIYAATGVLGVLAGAAALALRPDRQGRAKEAERYVLTDPQRG